jgi:hypothetical protein
MITRITDVIEDALHPPKFKDKAIEAIPVNDVQDMMIITMDGLGEMRQYHTIDKITTISMNHIESRTINPIPNHNPTIPLQTVTNEVVMTIGDPIRNQRDQAHYSFRIMMGEDDMVIIIVMIFHVAHPSFHSLPPVVLLDFLQVTEDLQGTVEVTGRRCNAREIKKVSQSVSNISHAEIVYIIFFLNWLWLSSLFLLSSPLLSLTFNLQLHS